MRYLSISLLLELKKLLLHCKEDTFYFKDKLHGCFVCLPEVSEEILNNLQVYKSFANLEVVKFKNAYKEHGIIEKQIAYN